MGTMNPRSTPEYFVIVRTGNVTEAVDAVSRYPRLGGIGWSFPMTVYPDGEESARKLKERMDTDGDLIIPDGYSGAPHEMLLERELSAEVRWAFRNPWQTGLLDRRHGTERWLMAESPDLYRADASNVYNRHASRILTIHHYGCNPEDTAYSGFPRKVVRVLSRKQGCARSLGVLRVAGKGHVASFACVTLDPGDGAITAQGVPSLARTLRMVLRSMPDKFVLLFDRISCTDGQFGNALEALSRAIGRNGSWPSAAVKLGEISPNSDTPAAQPPTGGWSGTRLWNPFLCDAAAGLRTVRSGHSDDRIRSILYACSNGPREAAVPAAPETNRPFPPERELIASMLGSATLYGEAFNAQFTGGSFAALQQGTDSLALPSSMTGVFRTRTTELEYRCDGAFSFESFISGKEIRGMVSNYTLDGREIETPGQISIHACFVEGFAPLVFDVYIQAPRVTNGIHRFSHDPIVFPLFRVSGAESKVEVESWYPDGTCSHVRLRGNDPGAVIFGRTMRFRDEEKNSRIAGLYLSVADERIPTVQPAVCFLRHAAGNELFCVSLFGMPGMADAAVASGTQQHMTFLLLPDDGVTSAEEVIQKFRLPSVIRSHLQRPWFRSAIHQDHQG